MYHVTMLFNVYIDTLMKEVKMGMGGSLDVVKVKRMRLETI